MILGDLKNITSVIIHCGDSEEITVEGSANVVQRAAGVMYIHPNMLESNAQWMQGKPAALYVTATDWCYRCLIEETVLVSNKKFGLCIKVDENTPCVTYNRRRHKRFDWHRDCKVTALKTSISCEGEVINVSEDGIAIKSEVLFNVKSAVRIAVKNVNGKAGILSATVMRSADDMIGCVIDEKPAWFVDIIEDLRKQSNTKIISGT